MACNPDEHPKPFRFRSLPTELRLRVLEHTHLGPGHTGGYDSRNERLVICDGELVQGNFHFGLRQEFNQCIWRDILGSPGRPASVPCLRGCRKLPVALFLVDHQMYREAAIEVFYPHAWFDFMREDLRHTLSFLRDKITRQSLGRVRRINFTMTEAQCERWTPAGALSFGYPPRALEYIEACTFGDDSRGLDYRGDWRAVLAFLASHANLSRLRITVDMAECSFTFWEMIQCSNPLGQQLRFFYDFPIDVTTALCSLKTLGALRVEMTVFKLLAPWLEREVLGRGDVLQTAGLVRHVVRIPRWDRMDQRLEGSNYHAEQ